MRLTDRQNQTCFYQNNIVHTNITAVQDKNKILNYLSVRTVRAISPMKIRTLQ